MTVFVVFGLVFAGSTFGTLCKAARAVLSRPLASSRADMTQNTSNTNASLRPVSGDLSELTFSGTDSPSL